MAADTIVTGAKLTAIADALRAKLGAQDAYTLDEIATAIASIQAGNDHLVRSLLNYPGRSTDEGEYRWAFGAGDAAALASHYEGMATTLSVRPFAFAYSPVTSIVLPEVSGNSGLGIGPAAFSRSAVESIALPPTWRMETFQGFTDGLSLVGASGVDFYTSPFCSCKRLR